MYSVCPAIICYTRGWKLLIFSSIYYALVIIYFYQLHNLVGTYIPSFQYTTRCTALILWDSKGSPKFFCILAIYVWLIILAQTQKSYSFLSFYYPFLWVHTHKGYRVNMDLGKVSRQYPQENPKSSAIEKAFVCNKQEMPKLSSGVLLY